MRKGFAWLLIAVLLISTVMGAGSAFADGEEAHVYDDGRARPSNAGKLQVVDGKRCDEQGTPVMLRGVSSQELIVTETLPDGWLRVKTDVMEGYVMEQFVERME